MTIHGVGRGSLGLIKCKRMNNKFLVRYIGEIVYYLMKEKNTEDIDELPYD